MVAERKSKAPYSPNVFEIDWENPLDLVALLKIGTDECTLDASLVERFSSELFSTHRLKVEFQIPFLYIFCHVFIFFHINRLHICGSRVSKLIGV